MRRRKWLERAKSLLIAVLALTVLALTVLALPAKTVTDTPWLAALVRPFASVMGLTQGELTATPMADAASVTGAAQPVAVSVRNPAGRTSFQFDTAALDTAFEQFGAALGQALEGAQEPQRTTALRIQTALGKTSVAFRYPGEISPALAASWLQVETALDESVRAQWLILANEDAAVNLYLVGEELFVCQTQLDGDALEQLLQSCTPDGSFFAFEDAQARFSSVEPLSLLPGQTPQFMPPKRQIRVTRASPMPLPRRWASIPTATPATPTTPETPPTPKPATRCPSRRRASFFCAPTCSPHAFRRRRVSRQSWSSALGAFFPP